MQTQKPLIRTGTSCDPEAVRIQLTRILSSGEFDASERNRRFLEYVVEETVEGRADRIKAYSIATSVFGRDDDFDPQQDAIVRIEAGRMRRSLEHYYLTSGQGDPIRITIPIGSYVPSFSHSEDAQLDTEQQAEPNLPAPEVPPKQVHLPSVRVVDFDVESTEDAAIGFARSISRHIIVGLTRFSELTVAGSDPVSGPLAGPDLAAQRVRQGVDFVLTGAVGLADGRLYVEALLMDAESGRYIWSGYVERDLATSSMIQIRTEVADHIVRAIVQPSGAIFSHKSRTSTASGSDNSSALESVIRFHTYWRTFEHDQLESVRLGLERAIISDPHYAEAFVCLSLTYSNIIRFGLVGLATPLNPLRRAIALAHRAIHLSPNSSRGYFALGVACWFSGQADSAIEALETSYALNPNDTEVTAELGLREALRGNWDKGVGLINKAFRQNPALHSGYRVGLSIWHYVHGRYDTAMSEAWRIHVPGVIYPHLMVAISATKLGRTKDAQAALHSLLALDPDYGDKVGRDLEARNVHPAVIEKLVSGLQEAGLSCGKELSRLIGERRDTSEAISEIAAAPGLK